MDVSRRAFIGNHFARYSCHYCTFWHVFRDYAICPNGCAIANLNSAEDHSSRANIHLITYDWYTHHLTAPAYSDSY